MYVSNIMPCSICNGKGHNARTCFGFGGQEETEHIAPHEPVRDEEVLAVFAQMDRANSRSRNKKKKKGGKIRDSEAVRKGRLKRQERLARSKEQSKGGCNIL
jgi:hypothetical protein